jgi:sortase A
MWNKPVDKLSVEELETLIRQRRAGANKSNLVGSPVTLKRNSISAGRRKRKGWEKALFLAEILAIAVILLITGISARGWTALRQRLPMDGVTVVGEQVLAASPTESTGSTLPAIGWRNAPLGDKAAAALVEPKNQRLETPEHLKRWLQPGSTAPALSVPTSIAQPATRVIIPSIEIDAPAGEGTDWESLKYKVGHHPGTANPGQRGNMVLAAHNDIYGEIFRYLPDVPVGEIITVYAGEEAFRYRITERRIITPDQVEVMLPTTGPTVTLISCYPYLIDTHRIVLFGELVS